jgi:threonine 3-dehydrogenase
LISAFTVPSGGTSDYVPEMLHAAAKGEPYATFVRADTRIPFMAMLDLASAPRENLSRYVYNLTSFDISAEDAAQIIKRDFPNAEISFSPDDKRQGIVDSCPAKLDDSTARKDWGWQPDYDLDRAFDDYLIPTLKERYGVA